MQDVVQGGTSHQAGQGTPRGTPGMWHSRESVPGALGGRDGPALQCPQPLQLQRAPAKEKRKFRKDPLALHRALTAVGEPGRLWALLPGNRD